MGDKMNLRKYFWAIRAIFFKLRFGKCGNFSYIGKTTNISGHARNIRIGNKVRIYPGLRAEIVDQQGKITIGNDVSIGQNLQITSYKGNLKIGDHVTIAGSVLISNNDHNYYQLNKSIIKQPLTYKKTVIGNGCFLGYGSVILAGAKLGKHCIVGANSVVKAGNYEDYCVLVGSPAKVVKKYSKNTGNWENERL